MLFGYKILIYCTSKIHRESFSSFIEELNDKLIAQNWRIMIFSTDSDLGPSNKNNEGRKKIFDLINYDIADAILISNLHLKDSETKNKICENAKNHNIPVLCIDGERKDTYNICYNQEKGFEDLVRHIVEYHKITNLHFIGGTPDSVESNLRLEAFKKVLKENNIPFNSSMVSYGFFWDLPTIKATQSLIDYKRLPKAIICANDTMALTVNSVLKKNGLSCPNDVLITGYDGINQIFYSSPKISSVLCTSRKMATETAEFLFQIMENGPAPYTKYIETSVFISESCGCKPKTQTETLDIVNDITNSFNRYTNEQTSLDNFSVILQESKNKEELIQNMKNKLFYNVICLVKEECLKEELNPNTSYTDTPFGENMFVLLDSDNNSPSDNRLINTKDIVPRMKSLLEDYKHPLIFAPICNIDKPIGYLCFCFLNYDKQNFIKIHQIGNCLGKAITNYRNIKFQNYLLSQIEKLK